MPAFEKMIMHFLKRYFCSSIIKTIYEVRGGVGDEIRKMTRMRELYRTLGAAARVFEKGSQWRALSRNRTSSLHCSHSGFLAAP